jgi:hypothetical protein
MHAARPLVTNHDPGLGLEPAQASATHRPSAASSGGNVAHRRLALHPDEPEIAARGAERDIALVEERHLLRARASLQAIAELTSPLPITIAS